MIIDDLKGRVEAIRKDGQEGFLVLGVEMQDCPMCQQPMPASAGLRISQCQNCGYKECCS